MSFLRLPDNRFDERRLMVRLRGGKFYLVDSEGEETACCGRCGRSTIKILSHYNGMSFKTLRALAGDSLFTLGENWTRMEERNRDDLILFKFYSWSDDDSSGDKVFYFETFNLMGVVNLPDLDNPEDFLRLEIRSRFDTTDRQPFLNYMLSRVYDLDLMDTAGSGEGDFLRVLVAIMFVRRLGEALQVGVFRQYRHYECNDLEFEGTLDLARHISENCPIWDKIAYEKRVIDTDVPLNHLLRYAICAIRKEWPALVSGNDQALEFERLIESCTPSWAPDGMSVVIASRECTLPVHHPYFGEYYEDLRLLGRMVLQKEGVGVFGDNGQNDVSGVLFDGAWLWEEYLGTILEPLGFAHFQVGSDDNIEIFQDETVSEYRHMYPDFLYEEGPGKKIVLDAKYKSGRVLRADVQELLSYALITGAQNLGLVFPPREDGSGDTPQYTCSVVEHGLGYLSDKYQPLMWTFQYNSIPPDGKIEEFMSKQEDELRKFVELLKGGTEGLSPRSPDDSR